MSQASYSHLAALALATAVVIALAVPPCGGRALLGGTQASLLGSYRLATSPSAADARIERAIDAVVSDVNPLLQAATRGRLTATNRSYPNISIREAGAWVTVQYGQARYHTRLDRWHTVNARGEPVRLLTQLRRPHLYQTFRGHDGTKLMVLTAQARSLWLDVTASSPNLPRAVRYRLEYRRVSG